MGPIYQQYFDLQKRFQGLFSLKSLGEVQTPSGPLPILRFAIGKAKRSKPALGLFAGVHGLEIIGVKLLFTFIEHILNQAQWDTHLQKLLEEVHITGIPIVNPSGLQNGTRSNAQGVDLMRNAPIKACRPVPFFGGQRLSSSLPFFQGFGPLEFENKKLQEFVGTDLWEAPFSLSLDIHSGFGRSDMIWTPYAKARSLPLNWPQYQILKELLDSTYRNHVYQYLPQAESYQANGDMWDYLYDHFLEKFSHGNKIYLPLTLEIGSWNWIRKSPTTLFQKFGLFNPILPHREKRVLRRHLTFLLFLVHVTANYNDVFFGGKTMRKS